MPKSPLPSFETRRRLRAEDGERKHVVFKSRAITRQRKELEEKKRSLERQLSEVNSNLNSIHDIKRSTRSRVKLACFEFSENVVFPIPMDKETVESRHMSAEAKRAIMMNMRNAEEETWDDVEKEKDAALPDEPSVTSAASSTTIKADDELLDVQIKAIMVQHAEDCKRMHPADAGRLAMDLMARLREVRGEVLLEV